MAPPQEAAALPVEKKKVDAAFWDKFKEFQTMPPEERFGAIHQFLSGYEKLYGNDGQKREVFAWIFAHPEWCRAAAVQEEWSLRHEKGMGHGAKYRIADYEWALDEEKKKGQDTSETEKELQRLKAPWGAGDRQWMGRIVEILKNASQGIFPSDYDFSETYDTRAGQGTGKILFALHQGSWQSGVHGLSGILQRSGMGDEVEQVRWLGSMDDERMKEVLWGLHDEWEKNDLESAQKKLAEEIKKWREGKEK